MANNYIRSHITIEEAEEQGLTQVAKQLRINELTRKGLGLGTLQDEIHDTEPRKPGPRIKKKVNPLVISKLIRVNTNKLT